MILRFLAFPFLMAYMAACVVLALLLMAVLGAGAVVEDLVGRVAR